MDTVLVKFAGIDAEFTVSKVLDLGFTQVRWYGAIIAFGFLLAVLLGGRIAHLWKINLDKMIDVLIFGTVGGIIGARAYYVAFEWDYYSQHLSEIYKIWEGGLAIYGGIIGGLLAAYVVCRAEKINFYNLLDMGGISLLVGQGIGRWGNYANQEAFGAFTYKNFGMMSDTVAAYIQRPDVAVQYGLENVENIPQYIADNNLYVHPTFFYESVWCLLGVLVLYIVMKKYRKFSGEMFLIYGIWYGLERAVVEGLRSDSLYIGNTGLRVSQVLSVVIVAVCGTLLVTKLIKYGKTPHEVEGTDYIAVSNDKEYNRITKALDKRAKRKNWKFEYNRTDNKLYVTATTDKGTVTNKII
ncbi:MAG: prolipoprotein diacylglyceryl transferase [Ruminococcaceae bacterium]|nr:prolipoprotein diacylglyceryl transferase [Oscillospiraceae bacterium]